VGSGQLVGHDPSPTWKVARVNSWALGTRSSPQSLFTRVPRRSQAVEKLPLCPLSPQIGYQTRRFWGFQSPICSRYRLNADFFNTLKLSRKSANNRSEEVPLGECGALRRVASGDHDLDILPLAITMMAGPQIISAIIFVTAPKPLKLSGSFIAGVAIATVVGVFVAVAVAALLGNGVSLGDPSHWASIGKLIQYVLVGLLVALALKNFLRRETVEPPRWLGALQIADWQQALMTGVLVIWLTPGDIIVMLTVATNLVHNDASVVAALLFIAATILIAALPLLLYSMFRGRAQRLMPRVRDCMNANSWLLNIIVCVVFIALILQAFHPYSGS